MFRIKSKPLHLWWYKKYKEGKVEFNYTKNSLDNINLNEEELLGLIQWWLTHSKLERKSENKLGLKYFEQYDKGIHIMNWAN